MSKGFGGDSPANVFRHYSEDEIQRGVRGGKRIPHWKEGKGHKYYHQFLNLPVRRTRYGKVGTTYNTGMGEDWRRWRTRAGFTAATYAANRASRWGMNAAERAADAALRGTGRYLYTLWRNPSGRRHNVNTWRRRLGMANATRVAIYDRGGTLTSPYRTGMKRRRSQAGSHFTNVGGRTKRTRAQLRGAHKYTDTSLVDTAILGPWTQYNPDKVNNAAKVPGTLVNPQQGSGQVNRQGNYIMLDQLHIRFKIIRERIPDDTIVPDATHVRLVIICDKQSNGLNFDPDLPWENGIDDRLEFRDLEFTGRFQVLDDMKFEINPDYQSVTLTNHTGQQTIEYYNYSHTFTKPLKIKFSANAGLIGDCMGTTIQILACSTGGSETKISYQSRARFYDE